MKLLYVNEHLSIAINRIDYIEFIGDEDGSRVCIGISEKDYTLEYATIELGEAAYEDILNKIEQS